MKLWNVHGKRLANGWFWSGRGWSAHIYHYSNDPDEWFWDLKIGKFPITVEDSYASFRGARNALVRAVKRLGLRVGKAGRS